MSGPRMLGQGGLTAFVPNGDSRQETAILLVGTASEYGIDQREIRATSGGFYISDRLADLLVDEDSEASSPASDLGESEEIGEGEAGDLYDPADYNVAQVKGFVTEHPDLALDVLESEEAGKNRTSLVECLIEFSDNQTSGDRAAKTSTSDKE